MGVLGKLMKASQRQPDQAARTHGLSISQLPHFKKRMIIRPLLIGLGIGMLGVTVVAAQSLSDNSDQTKSAHQSSLDLSVNHASDSTANNPSNVVNSTTSSSASATSGSASNSSTPSVSVTVDGHTVSTPANTSKQQVITTPDGTTTVNVSNNQSGDNDNYSSSFTTVNQNTNSSSSVNSNVNVTQSGTP